MEINEWVVVDGHYLEAVLAAKALGHIQGTIVTTKYNQILTVNGTSVQVGVDERFGPEVWVQLPALASLIPNRVSFNATQIWVDDLLVLECKAHDNTEIGRIEVFDAKYDSAKHCYYEIVYFYQTLFKLIAQRPMAESELSDSIRIANSYLDRKAPLNITERQEFNNALTYLAGFYSRQCDERMVEFMQILIHSDILEGRIVLNGVGLNHDLLVNELLMESVISVLSTK